MKKQREAAQEASPVSPVLWKRVLKWEGEPVLSLSLRRPSLPEDRGAGLRRIERYYREVAQTWRTRWEEPLYRQACAAAAEHRAKSRPFAPWQAGLDYTVTLQRDGLLSLYLDAWERTGSEPAVTVRRGDTWQEANGAVCSLRSFFPPHTRWQRLLLLDVQAQARTLLATGDHLFFDDWQKRVEQTFSPDRFYLTEEGICIFYPLGAIAPYAEDIPIFTIHDPQEGSKKR